MGACIAQAFAMGGYEVRLIDIKDEFVQRGLGVIEKNLGRSVAKGRMAQADADAIGARVAGSADMKDCADCSLAVEAVFEDMKVKQGIFQQLEAVMPEDAILASNT